MLRLRHPTALPKLTELQILEKIINYQTTVWLRPQVLWVIKWLVESHDWLQHRMLRETAWWGRTLTDSRACSSPVSGTTQYHLACKISETMAECGDLTIQPLHLRSEELKTYLGQALSTLSWNSPSSSSLSTKSTSPYRRSPALSTS